jgi:hypothetical protein
MSRFLKFDIINDYDDAGNTKKGEVSLYHRPPCLTGLK